MKTYICVILLFTDCLIVGKSQETKYEGDVCEMSNKELGVCVRISICYPAQDMLDENIVPINCGFIDHIPIVCCPKTEYSFTYLAEERCHSQSITSTGIIRGIDVKEGEFPHMAALGYKNNDERVWLCGGTVISDNFILTAAHCLRSSDFGSVKWVRLGVVDLSKPENNDVFEVIRTIAHPKYKPPLVYNDIGLIEIKPLRSYKVYIKPVCLHTKELIPTNTELIATGWGLTQVGGNQSTILQKTTLDLFTKEECDVNYNSSALKRRLKYGILHEQQLCAGGKKIGTDTCQGDSGGPLVFETTEDHINKFHVVGITSFGKSCGFVNVPGVYVRVSYYLSWIESIVWHNDYY